MAWETTVYERNKLYSEVWSEPVRDIAKRYGLSDVGLAKICKRLGVPVPSRGFWARKAAGEAVKPQALPQLRRGEDSEYRVERYKDPLDDAPLGSEAEQLLARERQEEMQIVVPPQIDTLHPLIRRYAALLRKASKNKQAIPIRLEQPCLAISAVGDALERALRIADAIVRALEKRGFSLEVLDPVRPKNREYVSRREISASTTGVEILESRVEFEIVESHDSIKVEPNPSARRPYGNYAPRPEYEQRPNGKLVLKITNQYWTGTRLTWADGKKQRLEGELNDFIVGLIRVAERKRLQREEDACREREKIQEERRRELERVRRERESQLVYDLNSRINDWRHAGVIRSFVAAVEAQARESNPELSPDSDLGQWLAWARERADLLEQDAIRTVLDLREKPSRSNPGW